MQVLCPVDFNRMVCSATSTPYMNAVYSPLSQQEQKYHQIPQLFKITPIMQSTEPKTAQYVTDQVKYLEYELQRMSEELRIRCESSARDREKRERLRNGCTTLLKRDRKMRDVLQERDMQIYQLEEEVRLGLSEVEFLKKSKETYDVSTQLNGVAALEDRIERLTEGLLTERKRNQRIKHLVQYDETLQAAVPPIALRQQAMAQTTLHVVSISPPLRRRLVTQSIPISVFLSQKIRAKLTPQRFLNAIMIPPPIDTQSVQTNSAAWMDRTTQTQLEGPPVSHHYLGSHLGPNRRVGDYRSQKGEEINFSVRSDSPVTLISPIGKVNHSFTIYEDHEKVSTKDFIARHDISSPKNDENETPAIPPRRPLSNRSNNPMNYSSEEAIKRAVAAAISKRKQLAAMGVSLGSARSLMSSSSSSFFAGGLPKARFGCIDPQQQPDWT